MGSHCSGSIPCPVGVPQGSVLGPLLFTIYTSPISHIAESHNIKQHQYADDTQLFVGLTSSNVLAQISILESCLSSLQAGFVPIVCLLTHINPNLSFLPPLRELSYYLIRSLLTSQACQFHSVTTSEYLVQCADPRITLSQHTKAVTKSCFYHIRTVKQICSSLDDLTSELFPLLFLPGLITQILFCMVFHLNIFLAFNAHKIPLHALFQVKATPNAVHPFYRNSTGYPSMLASSLKLLHSLLKLLIPAILHISPACATSTTLRSASANLLSVTRCNLSFGTRGFRTAAPTVRNSLPPSVRPCKSFANFVNI